ncbi:MAG TPA: acetoacetate decarboxylase family protein [Baekduia sp.]|uniref:acetoacetate decarboxylase family protein n=1 Tax=Baekduia sp. TaxID=2600305 RepID=UPI002D78975F|nr:acetoacetate decarboxylase family protein [Baekduia sp.]HET6509118.1 acetoacetate decarboxylase family protein [Baekduia sp.]
MGYVRTPEEIERMRALLSPALFTLEGVSVEFETTEAFARQVLPPCFEPDGARGLATVSRWQAGVCGEFDSAAVMLFARYGEVVGTYFLTLVVSGDMPVTIGREFWGEPKKLGAAHFYRDGDDVYAFGERNGTRIIEIEATFGPDLGPQEGRSHTLEVTAPLSHDASLAGDPVALVFDVRRSFTSTREGTGLLRLNGTPFDPVDEIPIVSVGAANHYTGESSYDEIARDALPDRERYLPYILGRSFDDLARFPRPRRHQHPATDLAV